VREAQANETILERWDSEWEALHPGSRPPSNTALATCVPWNARGESFQPDQLGPLGAWARVVTRHSSANQTTQGRAPSRKFERRGSIYVSVFAPINSGTALITSLADDVRTVFEGQTLGGVLIVGAGRTEEADEDGVWTSSVVILPFRYTETR
jgi:hypothetical protein